MKSRLNRYKEFIGREFIQSIVANKEYSLEGLNPELSKKIKEKQFSRIIFTGMGCSAIVSDIIKGFFTAQEIPIHVKVINDYDMNYSVDKKILKDSRSLVIISSYSGYSQEPINAYNQIKKLTKNIIFLTSGGKLGEIAKKEKVSVIYWKLLKPDREYPLFHAPQYFAILLDVFNKLGLISSNYLLELESTKEYLKKEFDSKMISRAKEIAKRLENKNITLLASAKWYSTLLKLVMMHFNEMSMVHSHRNYLHEFTHSEIASFTQPTINEAIIIFEDKDDDKYTKNKIGNLKKLFNKNIKQNDRIDLFIIKIDQDNFFKQFFSTLLFVNYVAYFLGKHYSIDSRELISIAAGNPWYNIKTIKQEEKK